jgi:hypothetical protein
MPDSRSTPLWAKRVCGSFEERQNEFHRGETANTSLQKNLKSPDSPADITAKVKVL